MIVLLWDSSPNQHRSKLGFSLARTIYCSLCMLLLYPNNTLGKSEIIRPATQEVNKPTHTNHKITQDSSKQPSYERDEYSSKDEYMANYDDDEDDDDDFNIYDELTRTESLAVVEDSINVFAKDIGAAFSDLLGDDDDAPANDELIGHNRDVDNKNIHSHQHHDREHMSTTTDRYKISIDDDHHSTHSDHNHSSHDHHSDHDHSGDSDHISHDHSGHDHEGHVHEGHDHDEYDYEGHDHEGNDYEEHVHEGHIHDEHDHEGHIHEKNKHEEHDHEEHVHQGHVNEEHIQTEHDNEEHDLEEHDHEGHIHEEQIHGHVHERHDHEEHDHEEHVHEGHVHKDEHLHEELNDADLLIEDIEDESLFAKMGLNPTEVKRQYFGWLRNKQQIIEQTNKDLKEDSKQNHHGHGHSKHNHEGHGQGHEQGHGHEGHSHGGEGRELSELSSSVWFVASASILVISIVGVLSVGFLPLLSNERGEAILQAFICIAVGTLVGDSFIHLAPHALTHSHSPETTWKGFLASMVVMAFIALDKILSFVGMNHGHSHSTVITAFEPILKNDQDKDKLTDDSFSQSSTMMVEECGSLSNASILQGNSTRSVNSHGHGRKNTNLMVIIGDAIHNFADGIAIGAAFSIGYGPGLSTSIAVLCHELPHEIGDFAILIQNGMRIKTALFYNLVSSITGFIGMCLGMIMGSKGEYSSWMIAGIMGVFLYVALVSMLPEITATSKTMMAVNIGGMVLGVVLLLVIGLYEEDIVYLLAV